MADNLAVSSGSGNTIAADDVGGILFQRVKACLGADGTAVDPSAGSGVNGTGVARVTIATDDSWLKAEDAVHSSGDAGVMALALRTDTAASSAGTTGDYAALNTDSLGKLWVTGTYLEDAAAVDGDKGRFVLAVRNDTDVSGAGTDGDYQRFSTDSLGRLRVVDCPAVGSVGVTNHTVSSADASTAVAVTAAPTSGQKLVIKEIVISTASALTITFHEESTAGSVFAKFYMAATSTIVWQPKSKVKLDTADKKLMILASGAGNVSATVTYYSEA